MNEIPDSDRVDAEWTAVNVFRELIRVGSRGDSSKATYKNALGLGEAVCPALLGKDVSVLRRARESDLALEYRQRAAARNRKQGENVTALKLVQDEIAAVSELIHLGQHKQKTNLLRRKLKTLKKAEDELDPQKHSEHQLIFRDAYHAERDVPELALGHGYRDFELPDENILRLRVCHPEKPEFISGADLIYERHDIRGGCVSLVAVQYKIWKDKMLPLGDERMQSQISKLKTFACDAGLCTGRDIGFRFPYCTGFLRPTDQLQATDQTFHSTGEHLPICKLNECQSTGPRGGQKLTYDNIRGISLGHDVFESLFNSGRIGSRSLSLEELKGVYKQMESLTTSDRLFVHAQDFEALESVDF